MDAKRHSLLREVSKLGSGAARRNCPCEAKSCKGIVKIFEYPLSQSHSIKREFVKFLSLLIKRKLFPLAPTGRESNCSSATSYSCERGVQIYKNTDCATECAMTNVGENFLKITSHSEDNNILSPKNLLKVLQEDLSLNAQDDERDFLIETLHTLSQISKFALAH